MKQFAVAFVCMALAAVAQAASTDWDWSKTAVSQNGTLGNRTTRWTASTQGQYSGNASFAARVVYTLPEGGTLVNGRPWMELFGFDNVGTIWNLQTNDSKQIGLFKKGTGTGDFTSDNLSTLMADGTLSLVLEYDDTAQTLALYVNDTLVTTAADVDINDWIAFRAGQGGGPLDREFPNGTTYDFALTTEPAPSEVPEPTALALLALGVAGVALRRRVA